VAAEITTEGFWEEFRSRVKAINPEAYIVAEIWVEAQEWLRGDRFDATMNYEWTEAAIAFTAGDRVSVELVKDRSYKPYPALDAAGYGRAVQRILDLYDWNVTQVQMNLLDSHDTARLLSIARGDKASVRLGMLLLK
jgi:glycosidase